MYQMMNTVVAAELDLNHQNVLQRIIIITAVLQTLQLQLEVVPNEIDKNEVVNNQFRHMVNLKDKRHNITLMEVMHTIMMLTIREKKVKQVISLLVIVLILNHQVR